MKSNPQYNPVEVRDDLLIEYATIQDLRDLGISPKEVSHYIYDIQQVRAYFEGKSENPRPTDTLKECKIIPFPIKSNF